MNGLVFLAIVLAGCGRVDFDPITNLVTEDDAGSCVRTCVATPPQSGCCAGDACQLVDYAPACVRPGARQVTEPCTDADRCAAGLTCERSYLTDPRGTCVRLCGVNGDCSNGAVCAGIGDAMGMLSPHAGSCTSECTDPRGGTGCGPDRTCRFLRLILRTGAFAYATTCDLKGTSGQNVTCSGNLDCLPGFGCNGGRCRQFCRVGMAGDCATGTCTQLNPAGIVFGTEYGLCV